MNSLATKWFVIVLFIVSCLTVAQSNVRPCKRLVLYNHNTLFNGTNSKTATAAAVTKASPLSLDKYFGEMVIFDDPVTTDDNIRSKPVAQAQGFYVFDGKQDFNTWSAFTYVFNSTEYKGTLTIMGADILTQKSSDLSVVGGTGDFFMAKGVCTVTAVASHAAVYFRLKMDIKIYHCY